MIFCLFFGFSLSINAQVRERVSGSGSSMVFERDTTDKSLKDSTLVIRQDSILLPPAKDGLDAPVQYRANDSMVYDVVKQKIYLYDNASVQQGKISLRAAEIVFDQKEKLVTATYIEDSTGRRSGTPVFSEDGRDFQADQMVYNFETNKGKIYQLVTKEGEGYLRGKQVKKNEYDEMFAVDASYSTCNLEHPHFEIKVGKVKVVPNDLIVSGPAQLVLSDVPTPLFLPFGIFPMRQGQRSGMLLPNYGYNPNFGYFFQGLGYYFGFSDKLDLALTGDIYTNGTFLLNAQSSYKKRYKYGGGLNVSFGRFENGIPRLTGSDIVNNFNVRWNHRQDAKARPNSNFNSSVNFGSRSFNKNYLVNNDQVLENTTNSSISYSASIPGTPFSYSINARHNQNFNDGKLTIELPNFALNMARIQPFKRKVQVGGQKWYEKIGFNYNMAALARVNTIDSLLFTQGLQEDLRHGLQHRMSLNTTMRLLKYFNINPSVSYTERWYVQYLEKEYVPEEIVEVLSESGELINDTIPAYIDEVMKTGFKRGGNLNGGVSLQTKLFGILLFKKGALKGIRHELTPSVGMSFSPDYSLSPERNFYRSLIYPNTTTGVNDTLEYSIFEDNVYGGPAGGPNASLNFSLNNNLQIKTQGRKDTVARKINIFDQINLRGSYNFLADSLNLSPISLNANTNFLRKIDFTFVAGFDPYIMGTDDKRKNIFEWTANKRLARFTSGRIILGTNFSGKELRELRSNQGTRQEQDEVNLFPNQFVDFNIPWRVRTDYTLVISRNNNPLIGEKNFNLIQTLNFDVELNLTPQMENRHQLRLRLHQQSS